MESQLTSEFYEKPIDVKDLSRIKPNICLIDDKTEVVVSVVGSDFRIFRNQCPHMGAPLSQGKFCGNDSTVQCPWHGYIFSCETGDLKENPNVKMFGWMKDLYKTYQPELTPKYRVQIFTFKIEDNKIYVYKSVKG